jgi:hypothetical protein
MLDTVGFPNNDFNPCYHEKWVMDLNPLPGFSITGDDGITRTYTSTNGFIPIDLLSSVRTIAYPITNWVDDFCARAENHFTQPIDGGTDLLAFLFELVEMITGDIGKIKKWLERFRKAMKIYRNILKKTGSAWLAWNFAIKPLLADLEAILNSYKNVEKRLKWLRERNHKWTTIKYRELPRQFSGEQLMGLTCDGYQIQSGSGGGGGGTSGGEDPFIDAGTYHLTWDAEISLSAWASVRYNIDDMYLEGPEGFGILWAHYMGLYNPVASLWELTPFSWLLDWFLSQREILKRKILSFSPLRDAEVGGVGNSLKVRTFVEVYHTIGDGFAPTKVGTGKYDLFVRRPDYFSTDSSPFRIPFEWYNASILAALVAQKGRRSSNLSS